VLYRLAVGYYSAEEEAAILAATRKGRVDQERAFEICEALKPPPDESDDADEVVAAEAAEDAEIVAILDGPPPDVPPPAPNTTPDYSLHQFDQAVPEVPAQAGIEGVASATLWAAEYLVREGDPERMRKWLARYSATERRAILEHLERRRARRRKAAA
jgi:hypothetical protein